MIPSRKFNRDLRLTRYSSDDGGRAELAYPFLDVGPIQSQVLPHFAIVRAAMTWMLHSWDFDDNALQILRKHANLKKIEVACILGSLQGLYSEWTRDAEKYDGQPARRWLSPVCGPTELVDPATGRRPGLASIPISGDGDMESEESTEDPDAGPRPCLPGTVDADLGTYIEDWARTSHAHVASQKVGLHARPVVIIFLTHTSDCSCSGGQTTATRSRLAVLRTRGVPRVAPGCRLEGLSSIVGSPRRIEDGGCTRTGHAKLCEHRLGSVGDGEGDLVMGSEAFRTLMSFTLKVLAVTIVAVHRFVYSHHSRVQMLR
jgi:hypothetical protein